MARYRQKASDLDRLLWAGFASDAVEQLKALSGSNADPEERAAAAWALARWFASIGNYANALAELGAAKAVIAEGNWDRDHHLLEISVLVELGRTHDAELALQRALSSWGELPEICLLAASVVNIGASTEDDRIVTDSRRLAWINKPFIAAALVPIELSDPLRPLAFDNLTTPAVAKHPKACSAKLSVIMPAYNAAETLPTALKSVLAQSWDNLEVLAVDDASTDDTWSIIQSFAASDGRVKPLRHNENSGTYAARNTGLRHASGDLVTVHDADDWSHAEKFAIQATDLLEAGTPLNITLSVRIFPDLTVRLKAINTAILYHYIGSLMAKRSDLIAVGGWDEPLTGADDELYHRLLALYRLEPKPICPGVPLTLMLARPDSLSASRTTGVATIKYGALRQYKEAYRYWHAAETAKAEPDLEISQRARPFPIPAICKTQPAGQLCYDVLYVSDFSEPDETAVFNAWMIEAGHYLGLKQAWFQWPNFDSPDRPVDAEVRKRAHANMADCVVAGEKVYCKVVVLYHPEILNHLPNPLPRVKARACILVADKAPSANGQSYDIDRALQAVHAAFGVKPIVAPVSPSSRSSIRAAAKRTPLSPRNWLPPLDAAAWKRDAMTWNGDRSPVIGGYTLLYLDHSLFGPKLRAAYCADRACEMRIFQTGKKNDASPEDAPANWIFVSPDETGAREFLSTLDVCVCYPHRKAAGVLDRAPIEAMAVGVPVILPPRWREVYGNAAVYAEPKEVFDAISAIWHSKVKYEKQVVRGFRFVEGNCSYQDYAERLRPYLESPRVSRGPWSKFMSLLQLPSRRFHAS